MSQPTDKTNDQWKKDLTPEQFRILREKGTERAFTGKYWDTHDAGTYRCAGCGAALFSSEHKYDSGSGWPSFFEALDPKAVVTATDNSLAYSPRVEILCAQCGGHLGHIFEDGPKPTGKRYCTNSESLVLDKKK